MKLSKKVLSMVLCGFIVLGGSQATLIKANAQSRKVVIVGSDKAPSEWKVGVRFELHSKNRPSKKDWWEIKLVCKDGKLKLEGPTNIPPRFTFDDTFRIGFEKNGKLSAPIVFRACNAASAGDALNRAIKIFNDADIRVGDKIFMNGEKYQDSLRFTNTGYIKGITGNDYSRGYQRNRIDQFTAGFAVAKNGLYEAIVDHSYITD